MTSKIELVRSVDGDGGWSLHPTGYSDQDYADGRVPILVEGDANLVNGEWDRPNAADWRAAEVKLAASIMGSAKTPAKAAAARANGRKGGRPRSISQSRLDELNSVIDKADASGRDWRDAIPGEMDGYELGPDSDYPGWENGRYITTAWHGDTPRWDIISSGGTLIAVSVSER